MNSQEFRQEIDIKRPRYLAKYYPLMETISNKGYALTFPHGLNRQPDYLWLQIKNGVRNE